MIDHEDLVEMASTVGRSLGQTIGPAVALAALAEPIPCVYWQEGKDESPGLVVAVGWWANAPVVWVAWADGSSGMFNASRVRLKFPPSGPWRLHLGWAHKGPVGYVPQDR